MKKDNMDKNCIALENDFDFLKEFKDINSYGTNKLQMLSGLVL